RVAPNMMVVVPTSTEVTLNFESSFVDKFAYVLTVAGFVAVFLLWRSNRRRNMQVSEQAHRVATTSEPVLVADDVVESSQSPASA
ncbi:MAG: hypothetical protein ACKPBG_14055, partial [Actinomycetota bacterium]